MGKNFRPFIIDVEASGFGSASYPIEIGLALEKGKQYCSLILPATEVATQLNAFLGQTTVFSGFCQPVGKNFIRTPEDHLA